MAWLPDASDPNQYIIDSVTAEEERATFLAGIVWAEYTRSITITRARYVSMTYAAAVTAQAALHNPTGSPPTWAAIERTHAAGAYAVTITIKVYGSWAPVGA